MQGIAGLPRPAERRWNSARPFSLIASLALHVFFCWTLLNVLPPQASVRQQDLTNEEFFTPQHSPIVWYHLQKMPKVSSEPGVEARIPSAEDVNNDTLISRSQAAATQIVRQPDKVPIPKIQLTDMIALKKGSEALPPAPPLPAAVLPDRPEAAVRPDPVKVKPKAFVPPAISSAAKKPSLIAPQISSVEPSTALPGGSQAGQNEINALVLNLLPGAARVPPPGQSDASAAPAAGPSGEGRGSGIQITGVTAAPGLPPNKVVDSSPKPGTGPKPFVVTGIASLQNTLSAPLPPSSRSVPAYIEAHFRGRVVYAMIVPMKKVPGYAGDWIIWFAEHQPADAPGATVQMRSPLPIRRSISPGAADVSLPPHVQISALIDKLGQVGSITIAGSGSPAANDAAIADLRSWEFLPAMRNRQPVDVDVLVEITYSSGVSVSR
jgi:hypothetical protein